MKRIIQIAKLYFESLLLATVDCYNRGNNIIRSLKRILRFRGQSASRLERKGKMMTTAVLPGISWCEIKEAKRGKVSSSRLKVLGKKMNEAADKLPVVWSSLSRRGKDELKDLAYWLIESPEPGLLSVIECKLRVTLITLRGQKQDLVFCMRAFERLVDTILGAVEREDSGYQQIILGTLEELKNNPPNEVINPENGKRWLKQLSDCALREV